MSPSGRILSVGAAIFVGANVVAALAERSYEPLFLRTRPEGDADATTLVISASYGHHGVDVAQMQAQRGPSQVWAVDGTSPGTWRAVLADSARWSPNLQTVVVQVAPVLVRDPGPSEDLALRRVFGLSDVPEFWRLGEFRDSVTIVTSQVFPLFRGRQGLRRAAWVALAPADVAEPPPVALGDGPFIWDASERASLAGLCADEVAKGHHVVFAEWPLGDKASSAAHQAVVGGFRPELQSLAVACGGTALVAPPGPWPFADGLHGDDEAGARWTAWLLAQVR